MGLEELQARLDSVRYGQADEPVTEDDVVNDVADADVDDNDSVMEDDAVADDDSTADNGGKDKPTMRERILGKINNILRPGNADTSQDDTEADTDQDGEEPEDDAVAISDDDQESAGNQRRVYVDPRFRAVATAYGWDENQIVQYASEHDPKDVIVLSSHMEEALGKAQSQGSDEQSDDDLIPDETLQRLLEEEENSPLVNEVVKPLLAEVKKLKSALSGIQENYREQDAQAQDQDLVRNYDFANEVFDRHSEDFDMLGKTGELRRLSDGSLDVTDPAVQVRRDVFNKAVQVQQLTPGTSFKQAMDEAMFYFQGKYGMDAIERRLMKKLEKNAKRVSPQRKAKTVTKAYKDPRDRKRAVINKALERHGRTLT